MSVNQRFKLGLQYLLPHHLLSRIIYHATRWRLRPWKNFLINTIVKRFDVDLSHAVNPDPDAYASFSDFFTRALKPNARQIDTTEHSVISPSDGVISQCGPIRGDRIFQAKGHDFSLTELIGNADWAKSFENGSFATIYLSPKDYHRVHMPCDGRLTHTLYIPGRLFSVAPFTVASIPKLFARNERLVCLFETHYGPVAVIMVGAMLVSSIETVWSGEQKRSRKPQLDSYPNQAISLKKGEEMGRFNMGSTVILLLPDQQYQFQNSSIGVNSALKMGQLLGQFRLNDR